MKGLKLLAATFIVTMCACFISDSVYAKEVYYTNKNGVSFTEEEYKFLSQMFWEGSQDLMTEEDYQRFVNSDLMDGNLEIIIYPEIMPIEGSISDLGKTVKLAKTCIDECTISTTATWTGVPNIRSYDVIGAYLGDTKLVMTPVTTVVSTTTTDGSLEMVQASNGFGVSIKLPSTGTNVIVNQVYKVTKGGYLYATYQHAKRSISLANSKKYTFSTLGYGNVFLFSGVAEDIYDQMGGLKATLE